MNPLNSRNEKIKDEHLQRSAYVYIRQSSLRQVESNHESRRRQYQMAQWAKEMGWSAEQVVIVDEDQGQSGSTPQARQGFVDMIRAIGRGIVGIVISLEISRLARNSPDWCNLIYLCRFTNTLISDGESIYDPTQSTDRLVLGIRGQVSESEIDFCISRMIDARWSKAKRGEAIFIPPAGYELDDLGALVMSPDESVCETIKTVFEKFSQLGNVSQVYYYFRENGRKMPVRRIQLKHHPVIWIEASYDSILRVLHHPIYAGAYVFGRTQNVRQINGEDDMKVNVHRQARKEWPVLIKDHHPGYISYDVFLKNQKRISENMTRQQTGSEVGPAREGASLLQGLIRCGKCGRTLRISYSGRKYLPKIFYYYYCSGTNGNVTKTNCQLVSGKRLDKAVVEIFLQVTASAGKEAVVLAESKLRDELKREEAYWSFQIEQARYEALRAERQYLAVDTENRVVARELERRWNAKLLEVSKLEGDANIYFSRQRPLTEEEVELAKQIGNDIRAVWEAKTTTNQDRKRLMRCLIEEVQVDSQQKHHPVKIIWKGGATTDLSIDRIRRGKTHIAESETIELLKELAQGFNDAQIVRIFTRRGIRNKYGQAYTRSGICALRRANGIACCKQLRSRSSQEGPFTIEETAQELAVSQGTVRRWLNDGVLRGSQLTKGAPWRIILTEETRKRLTVGDAPDGWVGLSEASRRLGMPKSTVAHWVKIGKLKGMRIKVAGRTCWRIDITTENNGIQTEMFDQMNSQ